MWNRTWIAVVMIGLVMATGCARSPEAKKARHLERGDKYAAREQHREAIIEYRNVLRYDPNNVRALRQLGIAHYEQSELAQAYRYFLRAEQLAPEDIQVRIKLGTLYLIGRQPAEARQEALTALEKQPRNLEALGLLAATARTPEELATASRRLEDARPDLAKQAKFHLALGNLFLRQKDTAAAEREFVEAATLEPKSIEAHSALANFYLARRDDAQAEREFKIAADVAPAGSPARVRLGDFYLMTGKVEDAKRVVSEITQKSPETLSAWRRLAEIAFAEQRYDESLKAIDALLKRNAADVDGLLLRGRLHLARRESIQAIEDFQRVLKVEPGLAQARYQLARAHLQAGNTQQARAELKQATIQAPNLTDATLALAELDLQAGAKEPAIEGLEKLVARQPRSIAAWELLGSAYLASGDPAKATNAFQKIQALAPEDPRGQFLVGLALRVQRKPAEAKKAFEAALTRSPTYVDPLAQLVAMSFDEKKPDDSVARVERQLASNPSAGGLQQLLGRVHLARKDRVAAERAFLKAVELDPSLTESYIELGNLYATSGRFDEALAKLDEALKRNPGNVGAMMLTGVILERKGDPAKAQQVYERILKINPRFAGAANNLAWLLLQQGGDKERALQLAQMAKEVVPGDPHVSDTLGWVLYQRGVYQRAVTLFKESAAQLPQNPTVQYHLGMASMKIGDSESARKALAAAVNSPMDFAGKEEARKVLLALK